MHWKPRTLLLRLVLPAVVLASAGGVALLSLPVTASALPESAVTCSGSLSKDPSGASLYEPDLTDYSFYCPTGGVASYSIIVNRLSSDGDNVDDYGPNPAVLSAGTDGQESTTESINCGGATPSNGINCYALVGSSPGVLQPGDTVQGSIDLTSQYCSYLPKGAAPGTPAVPRAIVELVITDSTGAQDGPFELYPTKACAKVPAVVPAKKTTKKKSTTKKPTTKKPTTAS